MFKENRNMNWEIKYKRSAYKFLEKGSMISDFEEALSEFLKGKRDVDIKKLSGKLKGHYRLRLGKVRIIFKINFNEESIYVKNADNRGDVYK